jgi:hypothetical protein
MEDCCVGHPRDKKQREEEGIRQLKDLYQLRRAVKSMFIEKNIKNVMIVDLLSVHCKSHLYILRKGIA